MGIDIIIYTKPKDSHYFVFPCFGVYQSPRLYNYIKFVTDHSLTCSFNILRPLVSYIIGV